VKTPTGERDQPVETVLVGAIFILRPGERVPLDGLVVAGSSLRIRASATT
jgi:Cd2+/Zn2+-exporting ATPase